MTTPHETARRLLEQGGKLVGQTEPLKLACTKAQAYQLGVPADLLEGVQVGATCIVNGGHEIEILPSAPERTRDE